MFSGDIVMKQGVQGLRASFFFGHYSRYDPAARSDLLVSMRKKGVRAATEHPGWRVLTTWL